MNSNGGPVVGLVGIWMLMQLAAFVVLLLGGIYALYCLGRAAAGLDRLASAVEEWVRHQSRASANPASPFTIGSPPVERARPADASTIQAQPFTPPIPSPSPESSVIPPAQPPPGSS